MATAWRSASWFLPAGHLPAGLPLVVTEIGESFWHHGDHVIREHSGIIALEWVIEGQMELEIDGSAQFVGPGQGFLLRRGEQQRYACVGSRARKRYIGVAGTWAAALVDGLPVVLADPAYVQLKAKSEGGSVSWACTGVNIVGKYLPQACR